MFNFTAYLTISAKGEVITSLSSLRWLDCVNHDTLCFFCHRIFNSARVKLSLGHCKALLVVFINGKVSPAVRVSRDIVFMDKVWSLCK